MSKHDEFRTKSDSKPPLADQVADAVSETAAARADATEWGDTK